MRTSRMKDETIKKQLQFLGLKHLSEEWDIIFKTAKKKQPSYHKFLTDILEKESFAKKSGQDYPESKKPTFQSSSLWKLFLLTNSPG